MAVPLVWIVVIYHLVTSLSWGRCFIEAATPSGIFHRGTVSCSAALMFQFTIYLNRFSEDLGMWKIRGHTTNPTYQHSHDTQHTQHTLPCCTFPLPRLTDSSPSRVWVCWYVGYTGVAPKINIPNFPHFKDVGLSSSMTLKSVSPLGTSTGTSLTTGFGPSR